jgi:hypothetical protein
MKLRALSIVTILGIALTNANADEPFSALGGIQARAMTSAEMDAVQGKTDWYALIAADQAAQDSIINGIVQQNMANPQVQTGYNQWIANGGGGTYEEYAYGWAATGGYSAQGLANYGATSADIANQYQNAIQGYWDAMGNYQDAYGAYTGSFSAHMNDAGNGLAGNGTFYNSYSGMNEVLPYTWQPGTVNTYNGSTYYVDPVGTYWQFDQNGYMYGVSPTW